MATLTIERGTGLEDANSYITAHDLESFLEDRGLTVTGESCALIMQAMDIIEQQKYNGTKSTTTQALSFPRAKLRDKEGLVVESDAIPQGVINGTLWLCYYIDINADFSALVGPAIKKKVIGQLTTEFAVGETGYVRKNTIKDLPHVYAELKSFLNTATSGAGTYRG